MKAERCLGLFLLLIVALRGSAAAANPQVDHVILISVDGLRGDLLEGLVGSYPEFFPNFNRFVLEGATTHNARTDFDYTITLPNHTTQLTGRPVLGAAGHNVTFNEDNGSTLKARNGGTYIPGVFDVVHDAGRSTGMYVTKEKFDFLDRSWNASGEPASKIDRYLNYPGDTASLVADFITDMNIAPHEFSFLHFLDPDSAGHAYGWGSPEWNGAVFGVDGVLGDIFNLVESHPVLQQNTTVILTADHGGLGTNHFTPSNPYHYTIPFYVWGNGVTSGADLYLLNGASRKDPGAGRPTYGAPLQPIRDGDAANLILDLLGLGTVPGSTINAGQDLVVNGTPAGAPLSIMFRQGLDGYSGTRDTFLQQDPPSANLNNSSAPALNVDGDDPPGTGSDAQALLRFENMFGNNPGQIPLDAEIVTATLNLGLINPGDSMQLHRMLANWNDTSTWNSMGAGVQADNNEALAAADVATGPVNASIWPIDVTASLQAWLSDPNSDLGWVFRPTGPDGIDFYSSEGAAPPELVVRYYLAAILGDMDCDGDIDFDDIDDFVTGLNDPALYESQFGVPPSKKGDTDRDGDLDFDDIDDFVQILNGGAFQANTHAVCEPGSWGLLVLGLKGIGVIAATGRRRRQIASLNSEISVSS